MLACSLCSYNFTQAAAASSISSFKLYTVLASNTRAIWPLPELNAILLVQIESVLLELIGTHPEINQHVTFDMHSGMVEVVRMGRPLGVPYGATEAVVMGPEISVDLINYDLGAPGGAARGAFWLLPSHRLGSVTDLAGRRVFGLGPINGSWVSMQLERQVKLVMRHLVERNIRAGRVTINLESGAGSVEIGEEMDNLDIGIVVDLLNYSSTIDYGARGYRLADQDLVWSAESEI